MEVEDRIYGVENIDEPILMDLISCPSVQRLKYVSQLGMPDEYYFRRGYSRFEHSLGVSILLKRLGASLEEQVAGLLHDVSHTAFSHVIDWIVGDPTKEDHQDSILSEVIENSEIPVILENYNFDYKKVSNHDNFSLLEREAPGLCADRIDYTLREINFNEDNLSKVLFENLGVKNNQIIFNDIKFAQTFAEKYSFFQEFFWGSSETRARYLILSEALKKGINKKIISLEDFNNTEAFILDKLESSKNKYILDRLNLLKEGFKILESDSGADLFTKFRYIDPEVSVNGSYKKLSELSEDYKDILKSEKEKSKLIKKVKIIPL